MTLSDYLQLAAGCGVVGVCLAAVLVIAGLRRGVRSLDGDTRQLQPVDLTDPDVEIIIAPAPCTRRTSTQPCTLAAGHAGGCTIALEVQPPPQRSVLPRVCPLVIEPGHGAHVWTFSGYAFRCPGYRGDPDPTRTMRRPPVAYPDRDHKRGHRAWPE